jgi:hypothetical protein
MLEITLLFIINSESKTFQTPLGKFGSHAVTELSELDRTARQKSSDKRRATWGGVGGGGVRVLSRGRGMGFEKVGHGRTVIKRTSIREIPETKTVTVIQS